MKADELPLEISFPFRGRLLFFEYNFSSFRIVTNFFTQKFSSCLVVLFSALNNTTKQLENFCVKKFVTILNDEKLYSKNNNLPLNGNDISNGNSSAFIFYKSKVKADELPLEIS